MSIQALSGKHNFRHSIADEMESLLYVILYCCARWLRHNFIEDLGEQMANFFGIVQKINGKDVGGQGKMAQLMQRRFTDPFIFEDENVGRWINDMYDLLWPREWPNDQSVKPNWTVEAVQQLWEKTLKNNLAEGGRQNHDVGDVIGEAPIYFPTHVSFQTSNLLSLSITSSLSSKRTAEDDGAEAESPNKRRRADTVEQPDLDEGNGSGSDKNSD